MLFAFSQVVARSAGNSTDVVGRLHGDVYPPPLQ